MEFILSLVLSLFSVDTGDIALSFPDAEQHYSLTESSSQTPADFVSNQEICLTAAQGYTFSGGGNSTFSSVRSSQGGRRTSQQTKSSFRIIKCGKVIDNNHTHPFLAPSFIPLSGTFISERYLFSICCLRI
ncbi:MAG: hypothetical protein J6T49_06545 [Bacteroidales bacterium]|nr:hypothetical protein [Bacteroidales bacterium]MBO7480105.1 hypothetical protein [Bacteroidales bacterium]MBO7487725.1 hypothetical protein [Bacteroidales bacterium]MBP5316098.1 hypothetical protein [Bacteroidales bacterium]